MNPIKVLKEIRILKASQAQMREYPNFKLFHNPVLVEGKANDLIQELRKYPVWEGTTIKQIIRTKTKVGQIVSSLLAKNVSEKVILESLVFVTPEQKDRKIATELRNKFRFARKTGRNIYYKALISDDLGNVLVIETEADGTMGSVYIMVKNRFDKPLFGDIIERAKRIIEDAIDDGFTAEEFYLNKVEFSWIEQPELTRQSEGAYTIRRLFIVNAKFYKDQGRKKNAR
jgi:hypothetical protein